MTIKEALKYFDSDILKADYKKNPEAYELAICALEKQIQKKPIAIRKLIIASGVCPTCSSELCRDRIYESNNYCPDCGQALKWEEE